jgi:TonB family protein
VKPTFTADALARKVQGRVVLELVVNRAGRAENVRVVMPLDPGLDEQAIAAARQWRFEPGRLAGTPVDVVVTLASISGFSSCFECRPSGLRQAA